MSLPALWQALQWFPLLPTCCFQQQQVLLCVQSILMYMRLCIVAADEHMLCILKARFHLALGELGAQAALHLWLLMLTVLSQSPA